MTVECWEDVQDMDSSVLIHVCCLAELEGFNIRTEDWRALATYAAGYEVEPPAWMCKELYEFAKNKEGIFP